MHNIPCKHHEVHAGQTSCSTEIRIKEHQCHIWLQKLDKSVVDTALTPATGSCSITPESSPQNVGARTGPSKAVEMEICLNNMNWKDGFYPEQVSKILNPLPGGRGWGSKQLQRTKQPHSNIGWSAHLPTVGPEKAVHKLTTYICPPAHSPLLSFKWAILGTHSHWLVLTFPYNKYIPFLPTTSASAWTRFSQPEDGGSTFLQNIGKHIYNTAQKLERRPADQHLPWKAQNLSFVIETDWENYWETDTLKSSSSNMWCDKGETGIMF